MLQRPTTKQVAEAINRHIKKDYKIQDLLLNRDGSITLVIKEANGDIKWGQLQFYLRDDLAI